MKKNKILLSAISGSVVLATIPALATSCNKNQPSVVEDIDFSQVTLEQHKYLNKIETYDTLLTYSGFELKTGSLDNLTVEVANIQGFDYGYIFAAIVPTDGSKFDVSILFTSEYKLSWQNPKFDLVFKEESTSWKTKTISGFSAYFTTTKLEITSFGTHFTVATRKNAAKFIAPKGIWTSYDDAAIPPSDSFEVEFVPYSPTSCDIKASLTTSKYIDEPYIMYLNFDVSNISADEEIYGSVIFKNKVIPEWFEIKPITLTIKTSIEDCFTFENFEDGKCDLVDINCCDSDLRIPSTIMHEGTEYTISAIKIKSTNYSLNPSITSLFIPNTIQTIDFKRLLYSANNLENIVVESLEGSNFTSRDDDGNECNCIIDTNDNKIIVGAGKTTIPSSITSIGEYAFAGRNCLSSIEIPSNITSIESYAFASCFDLKSIKLPATLTSIGKSAFRSCLSLESIDIPSSITSLPESCFIECQSLKDVNLPNTLTKIGRTCFELCDSLKQIQLPESLTEIDSLAFEGCHSLETIKIPSQIQMISSYLFENCTSLSKVELPDSLRLINDNAFNGCEALESIELPDSLLGIGQNAFSESGLKSLSIGKNVAVIDFPLAVHTPSLKEITVHADNATYASNGLNCILSKDGTELLAALETTKLDQLTSVTTIGNSAFGGADWLKGDITIPTNITTIESYAFQECYYLKSIDLSNTTITSIPKACFRHCLLLETVKLNDSIQAITEGAFADCTSLKSINLPSGVLGLGPSVFDNCLSLTEIELPDTITYIGDAAFDDCKSLKSIKLPSSLTSLGSSVFNRCYALTSVDFNGCGLTKIDDLAFNFCRSLESITLPTTVKTLGRFAFRSCEKIKSINIDNVTSIGEYAFYGCYSLESIALNNEITEIAENQFGECSSLKTVTLPSSLTTIKQSVFRGCSSLGSISIPEGVTYIGGNAFTDCESLTSAVFAKTDNWYRYQGLIAVDVSDPTQAAEILKEGYILTREEE